jgi:hypothetical protein
MMEDKTQFILVGLFLLSGLFLLFLFPQKTNTLKISTSQTLAEKFNYLSQNGNSSCSLAFKESILSMPDNARLQGSCYSPMSWHRYREQIEGLRKFKAVAG